MERTRNRRVRRHAGPGIERPSRTLSSRSPAGDSVRRMPKALDGYAPGWSDDAVSMMASRTAEGRVAFFLAALAPGMDVLDAGCGPGTITAGLARAVAPG